MSAPLAVSPTNPYPGLHLKVSLVRGAQAAGIAGLRVAILTPKETGQGDITVDTEIRPVLSEDDVKTATGRSLGFFAYKVVLANDQKAKCDIITCTASAGSTATQTITFAGTPTARCAWLFDGMGHEIELEWNVGETPTEAADNAVARINALADRLFFVASNVAGVVTLTARSAGPAGNDVKLALKVIAEVGATATLGDTALSGGTTEVDYTAALATAQVNEYDYILLCMSNADAQSASASANPARLATHIALLKDGPEAKLQQGIYGSTGTRSTAFVNTEAVNDTNLESFCLQNSRDLPCEVAAAEMADRASRRRLNSNANRVRQTLRGLRGAADKVANIPTEAEMTAAANAGLAVGSYDASGKPIVLRAITTYHKDGSGYQDRRCFDVNEVDALYDYTKDLRVGLLQEFQTPDNQVKVMRDRVAGDDPLPKFTVEERDIKAFIAGRTRSFWVPEGVIHGPAFEAALADGRLIVEVNDTDETQVDIFIPAKAVKILAKLGLFIAKEN